MSNELAMLDSGIPDYLKTLTVDDTTKALMGGGSSIRRISIKGGVWRLMANGNEVAKNEDRHLDVVIVAAAPKIARTHYSKKYEEGSEAGPPDCWSADGEAPDAKVSSPYAKRCVDCPKNVQGSGDNNTRACRFSQRIAVALANNLDGGVYQLTLPATSVFGEGSVGKLSLQAYAKMLGGKGIPITAVVTQMRFDTDVATPKVVFKPIEFLSAAQHQVAIEQGSTDTAKRAITLTVFEADNPKKELPAPSQSAGETADAVPAAEPMTEPVKRTKKTEEAAAKPDLSKILADWDD
jgi:hypothetical protein